MTFEKRIAKVGKGINVNLQAESQDKIAIYLFTNSISKKILDTSNEKYTLEPTNEVFYGNEVIPITSNIFVVRNNDFINLRVIQ